MRPPVTDPDASDPVPDDHRPIGLRIVAAGAAIEILLLVVLSVVVVHELVRGDSGSVAVSVFLVLFCLGVAWALYASTRTLWRGRRGGRAPLTLWQLLQGIVGLSALTGGATWAVVAGAALLVLSATVLVSLLTRRVVEATSG